MPTSYVNWVLTIEVCILVLFALVAICRSYRRPYHSTQVPILHDPYRELRFGETLVQPGWKTDDQLKLLRWNVRPAPQMEEPVHGKPWLEVLRAVGVALLVIAAFVGAYYLLGYIGLGYLVGYPTGH